MRAEASGSAPVMPAKPLCRVASIPIADRSRSRSRRRRGGSAGCRRPAPAPRRNVAAPVGHADADRQIVDGPRRAEHANQHARQAGRRSARGGHPHAQHRPAVEHRRIRRAEETDAHRVEHRARRIGVERPRQVDEEFCGRYDGPGSTTASRSRSGSVAVSAGAAGASNALV